MKKLLSLSLAMILCLGLFSACGKKPAAGEQPAAGEKASVLSILDTAYAEEEYAICVGKENADLLEQINKALADLTAEGVAQDIVDKYISGKTHEHTFQADIPADAEELVMATNAAFPPYEYYEDNKVVGIDAEMAAAIADKLGRKLVIQDTEFDSIIGGVQSGKYDMGMAGMTVTDERLQSVNFSDSYATGIQSVIVREDSEIKVLDDISKEGATYKIGVQQGTTGDLYSTDDFGEDRVVRFNKGADAVQALITGKVDCVIIDNEPAKSFVAANNG